MFDELITYALMVGSGSPVVALQLVDDGDFSAGVTLCLALVVLGLLGLVRLLVRHAQLPVARATTAADRRHRTAGEVE